MPRSDADAFVAQHPPFACVRPGASGHSGDQPGGPDQRLSRPVWQLVQPHRRATRGRLVLRTDALVNDSGLPDVVAPWVEKTPVEYLPESVLVYLLGSRYCETDQLSNIAWQ